MCGLGGNLFALVIGGNDERVALNASGRADSGADPARLRAESASAMPFIRDIRGITVPRCVDGLILLHERFATLPLADKACL